MGVGKRRDSFYISVGTLSAGPTKIFNWNFRPVAKPHNRFAEV